jgi:hypothetical protein
MWYGCHLFSTDKKYKKCMAFFNRDPLSVCVIISRLFSDFFLFPSDANEGVRSLETNSVTVVFDVFAKKTSVLSFVLFGNSCMLDQKTLN